MQLLMDLGFLELNFVDVIDILLVAFFLFQLYRLVRGSLAFTIFIGLLVIYVLSLIAEALELQLISEIFGTVKAYENIHGQEQNTHFFIENSLFIDYRSVIMEAPSLIGFKAVEDTTVVVIEYKLLLELYDKIPLIERIGRMMAERQLLTEFDLRLFLLNMDATQRYEHIMQNHPWIFQRFSLKDIASFIDIAPASLSRLRKFIQQGRTN